MNIAFLFNASAPEFKGYYGIPILDHVLKTGVLQNSNRNMRLSLGDVLVLFDVRPGMKNYTQIREAVFSSKEWSSVMEDRIRETEGKIRVYCLLFENMTIEIAENLHKKIKDYPVYLGALAVDYSDPFQFSFYKQTMPEKCRINGKTCGVFYSLAKYDDSAKDGIDWNLVTLFKENGFDSDIEDTGARGTIFDKYNTPSDFSFKHFKRIGEFKKVFSKFCGLSNDDISNVTLVIEELHPDLIESLVSAAKVSNKAETVEDFAQAALSGRRFLEKFADYLYPPKKELIDGHDVGKDKHKNRLYAYSKEALTSNANSKEAQLKNIDEEIKKLFELVNSGLHSITTKDKIEALYKDILFFVIKLAEINPNMIRNSYSAYEEEMNNFFKDTGFTE